MTRNSHGGAIGPDEDTKSDDEWESFKAILLLIKKGHKRLNMVPAKDTIHSLTTSGQGENCGTFAGLSRKLNKDIVSIVLRVNFDFIVS